ncbi:MAG TPA: 50S ribosomal protein L25 [Candidatus Binatia bacterium]|nr:50S ribosomal protein L25 [Candidatus Binatia bacterium]
MEALIIDVEPREGSGKGPARRARMAGKLPAIFYGAKSPARSVAVDMKQFSVRLAHLEGSHLIELRSSTADLDQRKVLLRDIQFDPVAGVPLHADFYEVALDKEIEVRVPIHFEGKAEGVTMGGILQPILREIAVSCLPTQIPDSISVDVSSLGIHDSLHLNDIVLPAGVTAVSKENDPVVTVVPPTVEAKPTTEEVAPAEGAEAAAAAPAEGAEAAKAAEPKKAEAKK